MALALAAAVAGGAGCGGGSSSDDDGVKLGVLLTLSGPYASIGENMRIGIEQAVADYNERNDADVELVVQDDELDPQIGVTKATQLVQQENVDAIVGIVGSNVALAVGAAADRLRVPIVTTNAAEDAITGSDCNPYLFRTAPSNAMTARSEELYITGDPDLRDRRWFAQAENYAYGQGLVKAFEGASEIEIAGTNLAPLETSDWSSQLARIRSSGANAVYVGIAVGNPLLQFFTQAGQQGLLDEMPFVPIIGMPDEYLSELGDDAIGLRSGGLWLSWTAEERYPELAKLNKSIFEKTDETPSFQTLLSYVGTDVVLQAITDAESLEGGDLVEALETVEADTALGQLAFREEDHQLETPIFSGTVEEVSPAKYGASSAFVVDDEFSPGETLPPIEETGCEMESIR